MGYRCPHEFLNRLLFLAELVHMGYFLGGRDRGPRGPGNFLLDFVIWGLGSGASGPRVTVMKDYPVAPERGLTRFLTS
jgi:hypothetical protein